MNYFCVVDVDNLEYEIVRGVDIKNLLPVKTEEFEKMLVTFNSGYTDILGEICVSSTCVGEALPKYWLSKDLIKGINTKLCTKLCVVAEKDIKFKLIYDNNEMSFTTYVNGLNEFMFKISGKQIKLEISSQNESAEVKEVYLDFYEC